MKEQNNFTEMKTQLPKRLDVIIAFLVFIICCLISFTEFGVDFVQEASVTAIIGG